MQFKAVSHMLIKLYEEMVDRRYQKYWDPKKLDEIDLAMYFVLRVTCDNYGYEKDGNTHHQEWERRYVKFVHIVIHKHHRVYVAITDDIREGAQDLLKRKAFVNVGNHDSCYRDSIDRELSALYFEAHRFCWSHMPEEHKRIPALADTEFTLESMFKPGFQFVTIKREPILDEKESNHGYLDLLTDVKALRVKFETWEVSDGK